MLTRGQMPQLCSRGDLCGGETVGIRLETEKLIRCLYELGRLQRELEEKGLAAIVAINPYVIRASPPQQVQWLKTVTTSCKFGQGLTCVRQLSWACGVLQG